MRPSQKIKLSTIIKRVLAVTAVLALIEVAFIYFYMNNKNTKTASLTQKETKAVPAEVSKDTSSTVRPPFEASKKEQVRTEQTITTEPVSPTRAVVAEIQTPETKKAEIKKPEPKKAEPKKVPDPGKKPTASAVNKYAERQLSQGEMSQLLSDINANKMKANNPTKCIQIRKTKASNIDNGFEIATFLKQHGFVISGREVVSANTKGILIDATASCIKLTIGTL